MQLDLAKAGIVAYGLIGRLPTYAQPESEPAMRTGFLRTTPHHGAHVDTQRYTIVVGTSAALFLCDSVSTGVAIQVAAAPVRNFLVPTTPAANASQAAPSSVLEMRPAHRSLRDVPREKMSDFERDYPW